MGGASSLLESRSSFKGYAHGDPRKPAVMETRFPRKVKCKRLDQRRREGREPYTH